MDTMPDERVCLCIDLKSFYASVECRERGLDPLDTLLVVADESRTDKTICLAVSPGLKAYGIPGRPRLFEVVQKVNRINQGKSGTEPSSSAKCLEEDPKRPLSYIIAKPRMGLYMEYSLRVYQVYRRFVSEEDIHVYSIDEVFIDLTSYLETYHTTPRELAMRMIHQVLEETGITATAGLGTNLYLAKVAMDILAKKIPPDRDGVRIAWLDEMQYREKLWCHTPITDFWRVGKGIAHKLAEHGLYTMGDVARCSLGDARLGLQEELLYHLFGVNAELLIDHAWGVEPVTIPDIKAYEPQSRSISTGQVLSCPYTFSQAELILREMAEQLALSVFEKGLYTDLLSLGIGFDAESLLGGHYSGPTDQDFYGRTVPKPVNISIRLPKKTASIRVMTQAVTEAYRKNVPSELLIRHLNLSANQLSNTPSSSKQPRQLSLFEDPGEEDERQAKEDALWVKEKNRQKAILEIRKKFGKNSILLGSSLWEESTLIERNGQIGGHKA